jgi:phosphoglycerate dehydrogenase-like enzyme
VTTSFQQWSSKSSVIFYAPVRAPFEYEQPLPRGHPLTKLSNVVLTSHLGWPTDEMYSQFADAAADILLAYRDGKEVPRFVSGH